MRAHAVCPHRDHSQPLSLVAHALPCAAATACAAATLARTSLPRSKAVLQGSDQDADYRGSRFVRRQLFAPHPLGKAVAPKPKTLLLVNVKQKSVELAWLSGDLAPAQATWCNSTAMKPPYDLTVRRCGRPSAPLAAGARVLRESTGVCALAG
jgi:hypothetical protein